MPDAAISLAYSVILSETKDLLAGNTLCALSLVGFEGILHFVQNDIPFVILSKTKDLEVCTTFHRLTDLEILHFVQNDNSRISLRSE